MGFIQNPPPINRIHFLPIKAYPALLTPLLRRGAATSNAPHAQAHEHSTLLVILLLLTITMLSHYTKEEVKVYNAIRAY
jgi:hypothetical protein